MTTRLKKTIDRVNDLLDRYILPLPVRFLTFRFVILLTMALLIPLIIYADRIKLVLAVNSYLNVMSVAVSSIVLLYATISEARQKQIAELQEKRATEDHTHVTEMHALIMQTLENQNKEMDELKRVLSTLAGREVLTVERTALPDVRSLHPRGQERFLETDSGQRLEETLHQNALVTTLRKRLTAAVDEEDGEDDTIRRPTPDEVNGRK
ncbi:MAG: hypothetical protein ABSA23_11930 [Anaerolineales bacterium]|jgi:hypothetical protein